MLVSSVADVGFHGQPCANGGDGIRNRAKRVCKARADNRRPALLVRFPLNTSNGYCDRNGGSAFAAPKGQRIVIPN